MKNPLLIIIISLLTAAVFTSCQYLETPAEKLGDVKFILSAFTFQNTERPGARMEATSTWKHIYAESAMLNITNKTSGQKYTLQYNPNDFSEAFSITLPFGNYAFESTVEGNVFESFLPYTLEGEFTLNSQSQDISLAATTDYGLVTVKNQFVTNSSISASGVDAESLTLLEDESSHYVYVEAGTLANLQITESYQGTLIERSITVASYKHYNFVLEMGQGNATIIDLVMDAFGYEEEEIFIGVSGSYTWKKLIENVQGSTSPYAFDREKNVIYFIDGNSFYFYSLETNQYTQINVNLTGYVVGHFLYNPARKTIQFWRAGRDNIFEFSRDGGEVNQIGFGTTDSQLFGANVVYNGFSEKPAFINGYGWFTHKNSAFELGNNNSWIEKRPNNTIEPYRRGAIVILPNSDFSKVYMIDGQGNQSGDQREQSCSIPNGLPWASDVGTWCWLRDIWEFDLNTWETRKILPLGSNFEETGNFGYDYKNDVFYSFGGYVPPVFHRQETPIINKLRKFDLNKDQGWITIDQNGDLPNLDAFSPSFYDERRSRFIVVTSKGIWELKL